MTADRRLTLVGLLAEPGRVGDIPVEQASALLIELSATLAALAARLSAAPPTVPRPTGTSRDRAKWLTPDEAAVRLRTTRKWIYRHQEELQAQRLSRKCLRIPLRAIERLLGADEG
jgi:hypothetical protein